MKKILVVVILIYFSVVGCSQTNNSENVKILTKVDSVSYSIGLDIGQNLKKQEIEITPEVLLKGMKDAIADTSMLTDDQIRTVMMNFQKDMTEKRQNQNKILGEKNKSEADAFFASNKTKEGVITLESGLQYKVLKSGTGKSPKLSSTVEAHYAGRLLDGTEFDNSYKRGTPFTTSVTGVIPGWTEILQLMKEGDQWEVYIPSQLAYGERGSGQLIGPNSALIFVIELISVK